MEKEGGRVEGGGESGEGGGESGEGGGDSTVSEDAGINPRTVAIWTLAIICSNHSTRSHPLFGKYLLHKIKFLFSRNIYICPV